MGTGTLFSKVKKPGPEADHSHPTSAEAKKIWTYTTTPYTPSWRSVNYLSTETMLPYYYYD
jgi:hypothetical protein